MKPISIALTMVALLSAIPTANAWLGDSEDALSHRYGKPKAYIHSRRIAFHRRFDEPLNLGKMLRPLTNRDDLLGEMLNDSRH